MQSPGRQRGLHARDDAIRFEGKQNCAAADHRHLQTFGNPAGAAVVDECNMVMLRSVGEYGDLTGAQALCVSCLERTDFALVDNPYPPAAQQFRERLIPAH